MVEEPDGEDGDLRIEEYVDATPIVVELGIEEYVDATPMIVELDENASIEAAFEAAAQHESPRPDDDQVRDSTPHTPNPPPDGRYHDGTTVPDESRSDAIQVDKTEAPSVDVGKETQSDETHRDDDIQADQTQQPDSAGQEPRTGETHRNDIQLDKQPDQKASASQVQPSGAAVRSTADQTPPFPNSSDEKVKSPSPSVSPLDLVNIGEEPRKRRMKSHPIESASTVPEPSTDQEEEKEPPRKKRTPSPSLNERRKPRGDIVEVDLTHRPRRKYVSLPREPTEKDLRTRISQIMNEICLDDLTRKRIRDILEEEFGVSLTDKKKMINHIINRKLCRM
ncbi:hypothetical protein HK104_001700 [Borealophlyctis nickersoniae]|nr:hypothetical protein HK104_001700 [Borealophlyctis nickersoniae]